VLRVLLCWECYCVESVTVLRVLLCWECYCVESVTVFGVFNEKNMKVCDYHFTKYMLGSLTVWVVLFE
jgi:hypothetical protein